MTRSPGISDEAFMTNNNSHMAKTSRLYLAVCMVGLFQALFGSYAQGQQVHQLFYNNSGWADANLGESLTSSYTGVGAFITTPNTSTTHAGNAFDFEGMSGFSVGNYQYVYYVGK
jgi:hypothetical protein